MINEKQSYPVSLLELAERFKLYFRDKICNIRKSFVTINDEICHTSPFPGDIPLTSFEPTTVDELKSIILTYDVNCSPEDPIHVTLLKNNLDFFIPIWMDIVNFSLSQGSIECLKKRHLEPTDKRTRPINRHRHIKKLQTCLKPGIRQQTHWKGCCNPFRKSHEGEQSSLQQAVWL